MVDLTSNILPRALNPLDPKREHTQSEETSKRSGRSRRLTSVFEHLKCTCPAGLADLSEGNTPPIHPDTEQHDPSSGVVLLAT